MSQTIATGTTKRVYNVRHNNGSMCNDPISCLRKKTTSQSLTAETKLQQRG